MQRRFVLIASLAVGLTFSGPSAYASEQIGVLMLHGKSPGHPQDPNFSPLKTRFEQECWKVQLPDMPWSRSRYLEGNWDGAMGEIAAHVKTLRGQGATRVVLVGHSMGVPAALSHAARGGDAQALVLLAPGHVPQVYYTAPSLQVVRESIDKARALVTAGNGDTPERFNDINQRRHQPVVTTARNFLSYFDPASDAEMSITAGKIPASTPVMTVVGENDPLFSRLRSYMADKLPANPKTQYLEVAGGHLDTPRNAAEDIVKWIKAAVAE
jgi:pimeloyl-ACP methyl ester carboxylesterase